MTTVIDLTAELAKLTMCRGRTPQTTSADRAGTSAQLAPYRDGAIFTSKFSGKGAWERHMQGDELVHVLDGSATLRRRDADDRHAAADRPHQARRRRSAQG